jgi:hypothetical protein
MLTSTSRSILTVIIVALSFISVAQAQAASSKKGISFFETEITQMQTSKSAQEYFKKSTLKSYPLSSVQETARLEKTKQFLTQVKREASRRYGS